MSTVIAAIRASQDRAARAAANEEADCFSAVHSHLAVCLEKCEIQLKGIDTGEAADILNGLQLLMGTAANVSDA